MEAVKTSRSFQRYKEVAKSNAVTANTSLNSPDTKHYLWYAGEDLPYKELASGKIFKGEVCPVMPFPVWDKIDDVPQGFAVRTRRTPNSSDKEPTEALYFIDPHPIAGNILKLYGDWGVVDLRALIGWEEDDVIALDIDHKMFPNGYPATYAAASARIEESLRSLQGDENFELYASIANDMFRSIKTAQIFDHAFIDQVENNIEMSKVKEGYQQTYDMRALAVLERLERQRKDLGLIQSTARQNAVVDALPDLIAGLGKSQASLSPEQLAEVVAQTVMKVMANASKTEAPAPVVEPPAPQLELRRGPGRPPTVKTEES